MRTVLDAFLDPDTCARVCDILDRRAGPARPGEDDPDSMAVFDDGYAIEPGRVTLAELATLDEVRGAILDAVSDLDGARDRALTTDQTIYKRAIGGHFKGPHDDTSGFPHRIFTAVIYFKDSTSGAIVFGRTAPDGSFVGGERLLPAAGRLVLFDDAPDNTHAVEPFSGDARYSMMMWFRVAPERGLDSDWLARWFAINRAVPLSLTARALTVSGDTLTIDTPEGDAIDVDLEPAHRAWIAPLTTTRPTFTVDGLAVTHPTLERDALIELLSLLVRADALLGLF